MPKKLSIGYIYCKRSNDLLDTALMKELSKQMNVVPIILEKQYNFKDIALKARDCQVIVNFTAEGPLTFEAVELVKTFEEMGKRAVNSSHSFYYNEDKWMFYLKCLENKLPTPITHLVPREGYNESIIKEYLEKGPLVLKSVFSEKGTCVEKVNDYKSFLKKMTRISDKDPLSVIIAQKFIPSNNRSYRATVVGYKVVQSIVKIGKSWKQTGNNDTERYRTVKLDRKLKNICERTAKALGMELCGLDLVEHENNWYIIEANSCPGLDFVLNDKKRLIKVIANYLHKICKQEEHGNLKKRTSKNRKRIQ